MKTKHVLILLGLVLAAAGIYAATASPRNQDTGTSGNVLSGTPSGGTNVPAGQFTVVAENLDTPWALAFLPDGSLLVTERAGKVRFVDKDGNLDAAPVATIRSAREVGEGGLLGVALHPDFSSNGLVYLYYTYGEGGGNTLNRVVRMTYSNKLLADEAVVVDNIPGASNHNGGRIKFGPDKFLYIATGDAQEPSQAQDRNSLAGKILRVTESGEPAPGNPFDNLVYSYGHRNVQGLAWDGEGQLWATEHGRSGAQSGLDELNLIEPGKNYGWPDIQGSQTRIGLEAPRRHSGSTTWAPAGAAFVGGSLFFGGLRGQTLYEAVIQNGQVASLNNHFAEEFGRIREVATAPDGTLYIATSNRDGRGDPQNSDDKIIKMNLS